MMTHTVDTMTERLLVDAGIGAGMHVLDVGCGRGEVSRILARLVGPGGGVLGVDRDPALLATARARARELGLDHVRFAEVDLRTLGAEHGPFDAAVGRRVLMYQPEPIDAVRAVASTVRPGGLVVFHECDGTLGPGCVVPLPLHVRVEGWIWRTIQSEGVNVHQGFELPSVLEGAGLQVLHLRAEAILQTPDTQYPTAGIVRAMLPRIVRQGIATEAEIDIDTLEQRLDEERAGANTVYVGEMLFGAWARKPG